MSIPIESIKQGLALLPERFTNKAVFRLLVAIGLQESRFTHRYQVVQGKPGAKGPARGFWQFELGSQASRGGVWGVVLHKASRGHLENVCESLGVPFDARTIWQTLETNDKLAAAVARLLILTDPFEIPTQQGAAWNLYAQRCWRPGKPHPQTWPDCWKKACDVADQVFKSETEYV